MRRLLASKCTLIPRPPRSVRQARCVRYYAHESLAGIERQADDHLENVLIDTTSTSTESTRSPYAFTSELRNQEDRELIQFPSPRLSENDKGPKFKQVKRRTNVEVLALFDACVATGNTKRSLTLLRQIQHQTDSETTLRAANRYLRHLVECAEVSRSITESREMFDEYTSVYGITPDARAHALICRAALTLEDPILQKATIRDMVKSWRRIDNDFGEILSLTAILTPAQAQAVFDLSNLDYRMIGEESRAHLKVPEHPLEHVAEVMPTRQKGVGLKVVKQSLNVLTNTKLDLTLPTESMPGNVDEQNAFNLVRQRLLEENALDAAVLRWRHEHEDLKKRGGLAYKKTLNVMFWEWKEQIVPLIQEELSRVDDRATDGNRTNLTAKQRQFEKKFVREAEPEEITLNEQEADYKILQDKLRSGDASRARRDYGPFLGLLKPEKMAAVAILELVRFLTTETVDALKTALVSVKIGRAIENEYHSELLKKKSTQNLFQNNYRDAISSQKLFSMSVREARANAAKKAENDLFTPEWTQATRAQLGALMISFVMYAARISMSSTDEFGTVHTQEVPAFYHSYQYIRGQKLGVIKANEELTNRLSSEPLKGSIYPRHLPMLTPPRPWYSWNSGGYLFTRTLAMRSKNSPEQVKYLRTASERGLLSDVLMALDVLGHTPWKINDRVFQCALEAWNSGEAVAEIPPAVTNVDLPPRPAYDADPAERFAYMEKVREAGAMVKNFSSMRSDINYKLEIARAFLNDTMYFPHSLDFRGRAYPIPPHFNHLGNDLCRGLLKFGTARELGVAGLRWLKIHLANQCGFDKASFEEREAFADKNMERVFEASDHPMDGTRWWLATDKPWQCLATCFELASAMRSEDPTKFMSSMPVHQDGTCNGLQHYAALGGDFVGAKQVNLQPSERPQDVYRGVADLVAAQVKKDAEAGHDIAKQLDGHISRKLVKQTVMTNVYGVTWVGARLQIEGQLKDLDAFKGRDIFKIAAYVVNQVFAALKSMFTGAHEIQEWLRQSAALITRSIHVDALLGSVEDPMTSVIWTSPLELPIVQPYRREVRRQIYTNLQTVFLSDPSDTAEVNSKKQSSAFPPNFIHSLDATHMLMSALACKKHGISFAAVHDSYWTHAADTDTMNVVLRDAFIKLHSQDLMNELETEFRTRYRDHYSPVYHIGKSMPAVKFAVKKEHVESGQVQILPKNRGIIIKDIELARKVLKYRSTKENAQRQKKSPSKTEDIQDPQPGGSLNQTAAQVTNEATEQDMAETMKETFSETMDGMEGEPRTEEERDEEQEANVLEDTEDDVAADDTATPQAIVRKGAWAVWTPIAFPKLPKKGEFNVETLRSSKYFFS